jgi:hypothetical protein
MYTTCLLWSLNVVFFLKKEGEESHARMSGMHVRMFHIYIYFLSHFSSLGEQGPGILICSLACNNNDGKLTAIGLQSHTILYIHVLGLQ